MTICCSDTDVVVLAVATFQQLEGIQTRWFPIHVISKDLGIRAVGLPFFHAFSRCDTVSAFRGKGKTSAWQTWEVSQRPQMYSPDLAKDHIIFLQIWKL